MDPIARQVRRLADGTVRIDEFYAPVKIVRAEMRVRIEGDWNSPTREDVLGGVAKMRPDAACRTTGEKPLWLRFLIWLGIARPT